MSSAVTAGTWMERANRVTPGGVHSPVRAFKAMGMLSRGVLLPPSQFESAFLSLAHDMAAIAQTVEAARHSLHEMAP